MCFVCVCYAWAARGSGVTHTIPKSKGVGFLPSRVWLASSSYGYRATLITNSSGLFTTKHGVVGWLGGWSAKLGEGQGFSLGQSSAPPGLPVEDYTWAGARCRTGRLWARRTPEQKGLSPWRSRRPRTRPRIRGVWSPQPLHFLHLHRHHQGHQSTRGLDSSSTLSWLMGVPQAASTDSPMSRSCMARSLRCSTSPHQRYKTKSAMHVNLFRFWVFFLHCQFGGKWSRQITKMLWFLCCVSGLAGQLHILKVLGFYSRLFSMMHCRRSFGLTTVCQTLSSSGPSPGSIMETDYVISEWCTQ